MATKTIGITEDVYERLVAEKREDESFTDTIDRLLDTATDDWRHGFGRYSGAEGDDLERIVVEVRREYEEGFAQHQDEVLAALGTDSDEQGTTDANPNDETK